MQARVYGHRETMRRLTDRTCDWLLPSAGLGTGTVVALLILFAGGASPARTLHIVCLCEVVLVAMAAPFWAAGERPLRAMVIFMIVATLICVIPVIAGGAGLIVRAGMGQCICLAFGLMLLGLTRVMMKAMARSAAQLAGSLLGLLMCGTIFYVNPLIESAEPSLKPWLIRAAITPNPLVALTAGAFGQDILRSRVIYSRSVIGQFYQYNYPHWAAAAGAFAVARIILLLISKGWQHER